MKGTPVPCTLPYLVLTTGDASLGDSRLPSILVLWPRSAIGGVAYATLSQNWVRLSAATHHAPSACAAALLNPDVIGSACSAVGW